MKIRMNLYLGKPLLSDYQLLFVCFRFINAFLDAVRASSDGYLLSDDIYRIVESFLPGFHAHAIPICIGQNARPQNGYFPIEEFTSSLMLARELDFDQFWRIRSETPGVDTLQEERLEIFNQTSDPHPRTIFNLDNSAWFRNLISEKISVDRFHCTYVGSVHFAEVILPYQALNSF